MRSRLYILLLLLLPFQWIAGQIQYTVDKTLFSSSSYDEFSPAFFRDRIVYCSNLEDDLFFTFQTIDNKALFNIVSIPANDTLWNNKPDIFSRNIATPFNEGPASFSADGRIMVYSRNVDAGGQREEISQVRLIHLDYSFLSILMKSGPI